MPTHAIPKPYTSNMAKWDFMVVVVALCTIVCVVTAGYRFSLPLDSENSKKPRENKYEGGAPNGFDWRRRRNHVVQGAIGRNSDGNYVFISDMHTRHAIAWGSYIDGEHTASNFGQIHVSTSGAFSDEEQAFAAGYLEGYLTAHRVYQQYANLYAYFTNNMNASLEKPMKWVNKQDTWVRKQCKKITGISAPRGMPAPRNSYSQDPDNRRKEKRLWVGACLTIRQFDGVVAGYTAKYEASRNLHTKNEEYNSCGNLHQLEGKLIPKMTYQDFLFLENNGDLYDIIDKYEPSQRPNWNPGGDGAVAWSVESASEEDTVRNKDATSSSASEAEALFHRVALSGKCSSLIKVAPDFSDLWIGHSTWDSYTAMLRIWKHYSFQFQHLNLASPRMSFSSYPGEVFSDDDFFLLSSGLVVTQTTNKIFNDNLFDLLSHKTLPSWQRVRTANWLAETGGDWAQILDWENSGTYNSQYMVVDLKRFVPGKPLQQGLLTVAEQIPGKVVAADTTAILFQGYWPSFNVPYFKEIYNDSGYPDFVSKLERFGQHFSRSTHWLSYKDSPRAQIFRRDHRNVNSVLSMAKIMRSNDWRNDPLSEGHPICAICGRGDLDKGFTELRGCYDTKATSWSMASRLEAIAVNGPTTGTNLPPFQWSMIQSSLSSNHDADLKALGNRHKRYNSQYNLNKRNGRMGETLNSSSENVAPLHLGHPDRFMFQFETMSPRFYVSELDRKNYS